MPWIRKDIRRTPPSDTSIFPLVRKRIRIPQPTLRPIDIHARDLIRKKYVKSQEWWFTKHRRGIRREKVGLDPLEMRAVPKSVIRGTLPERILYNALVKLIHLVPDSDFDFQSSQDGGRLELGGIVADFLFPYMRIVISVEGPTHLGFLRSVKDEEQEDLLSAMGYRVYGVKDTLIYDEHRFEEWLYNLFNIGGIGGGTGGTISTPGLGASHGVLQQDANFDEGEVTNENLMSNIIGVLDDTINILQGSV